MSERELLVGLERALTIAPRPIETSTDYVHRMGCPAARATAREIVAETAGGERR